VEAVSDRERLEELAALQALGLIEAGSADLEAFLHQAGERGEVLARELAFAASALSVQARPVAPRAEVRARLLASLGPARAPESRAGSSAGAWLALAAAALLLVLVGLDDWKLRRTREELSGRTAELSRKLSDAEARARAAEVEKARQELYRRVLESEDVRVLSLGGKEPQPAARARMFWSEKAKRGVIVAGNLQMLPADKQYELWVFDRGKPVAAGVFDCDPSGRVMFESPDMSMVTLAQNFAVTIEPKGGMPQPTGPIVLIGS
jgi:anti-sigma-K factor RskA